MILYAFLYHVIKYAKKKKKKRSDIYLDLLDPGMKFTSLLERIKILN